MDGTGDRGALRAGIVATLTVFGIMGALYAPLFVS